MEDNFVPLFAFASNLEFFGVFPECKSFVQNNIRLGEIVELPEGRGFAVVLGVGLLEFATNLSVLLSRFAAEGPFTHVVLAGICGAYPGRGVSVGDVVRVDSEIAERPDLRLCCVRLFPFKGRLVISKTYIVKHLKEFEWID
jgi:futalosine hydrolase